MHANRVMLRAAATSLLIAAAAVASDEVKKRPKGNMEQIETLGREMAKLGDWDEQFAIFEPSIDRFWTENGWNDESDTFARDTLRKVAAIPPWEFARRMECLTGEIRERYQMNDEQFAGMQSQAYQMAGTMLMRHGGTIYRHTREAVGTRSRREPFTAEQVARWSRESDAIMQDMRRRFEGAAAEVSKTFTPEQREILERDMSSYRRRMKVVDGMRTRWKKGEWHPRDWWLENDPIHAEAIRAHRYPDPRPRSARQGGRSLPHAVRFGCVAYDETTWERYVRRFISRHELDEAQARTALSILSEMQTRASDYRRLHRDELKTIPPQKRSSAKAYRPIHRMYDELVRRLRPIPTDAQRRKVAEEEQRRKARAAQLRERAKPTQR